MGSLGQDTLIIGVARAGGIQRAALHSHDSNEMCRGVRYKRDV